METSTGFTNFTPKGPSISKVLYGPIMSYQFYPNSESDRFYTWEATGFACSLKMHRKASRQVGLWSGHVRKVSGPKILKSFEKKSSKTPPVIQAAFPRGILQILGTWRRLKLQMHKEALIASSWHTRSMLLLFIFVHILQELTEANSVADAEPSSCIMAHLDRILTRVTRLAMQRLPDLAKLYIQLGMMQSRLQTFRSSISRPCPDSGSMQQDTPRGAKSFLTWGIDDRNSQVKFWLESHQPE